MDVELGMMHCPRPVTFSTDSSAEEVNAALVEAQTKGAVADLIDDKGRHILVNGAALGYAIVGSQTRRPVGFGSLE